MKRLLSIAAVILVLAVPSLALSAEPDSTASPARPNSLYKGARAIQFLSEDWMSSGSVFFKTHRAAGHALRLGLSFSADTRDTDASLDTTLVVATGWQEYDSYSVAVELIMQRYANVFSSANVFYGIGPFFSLGSSHDERQNTWLETGDVALDRRDTDSWSVGARLVLGGEWFISRSLGLDIEYYISGGYRSYSVEYWSGFGAIDPVLHSDEQTDSVFLNGGAARIGLGIYF